MHIEKAYGQIEVEPFNEPTPTRVPMFTIPKFQGVRSSKVNDKPIQLGVTQVQAEVYTFNEPQTEDVYTESEVDYSEHKAEPFVRKRMILPEILKSVGEDLDPTEHGIAFDNVVDIPSERLQGLIKSTEEMSHDLSKILLDTQAALHMAYDTGSAYTEAVLRDCLNTDMQIDASMLPMIDAVGQLNIVSYLLSQQEYVSKAVGEEFLSKYTDSVIEEVKLTQKANKAAFRMQRYKSEVTNMQGRVDINPLGHVRGTSNKQWYDRGEEKV